MNATKIKIEKLKFNDGQIEGLPGNPRYISDEKFEKLKKSISDDPEMLELREIIAVEHESGLIVVCGNMRLRAMTSLGYKECLVKVLPKTTTVDQLRAYTIKDNISYGQNDFEMIANEWDMTQLIDWGFDVPFDLIAEPEKSGTGEQSPTLKIEFISDEQKDMAEPEIEAFINHKFKGATIK